MHSKPGQKSTQQMLGQTDKKSMKKRKCKCRKLSKVEKMFKKDMKGLDNPNSGPDFFTSNRIKRFISSKMTDICLLPFFTFVLMIISLILGIFCTSQESLDRMSGECIVTTVSSNPVSYREYTHQQCMTYSPLIRYSDPNSFRPLPSTVCVLFEDEKDVQKFQNQRIFPCTYVSDTVVPKFIPCKGNDCPRDHAENFAKPISTSYAGVNVFDSKYIVKDIDGCAKLIMLTLLIIIIVFLQSFFVHYVWVCQNSSEVLECVTVYKRYLKEIKELQPETTCKKQEIK